MLQTRSTVSSTNSGLSGGCPYCLYLETSQAEPGERHRFDPKPLQRFSKPDYRKLSSARAELGQMETALAEPHCKLHDRSWLFSLLWPETPCPTHVLPGRAVQQVHAVRVCGMLPLTSCPSTDHCRSHPAGIRHPAQG